MAVTCVAAILRLESHAGCCAESGEDRRCDARDDLYDPFECFFLSHSPVYL